MPLASSRTEPGRRADVGYAAAMPRTNALLGRLLAVLAPLASLAALGAAGCSKTPPSGPIEPNDPGKRFDPNAPPSAAASPTAAPTIAAPPPTEAATAPTVTAGPTTTAATPLAATAGTSKGRSLASCPMTFFVKTNPMRTGGPYRMPVCYIRSSVSGAPPAACLPADSPRLVEAVPSAAYAECVERGPEPQTDKRTGEPTCCYVLGAMGEGRPLLVADRGSPPTGAPRIRRVVAPLAPGSPQNAWG